MKVKIQLKLAYRLLNPGPTVLITTNFRGQFNIMPVSWVMPLEFDPPKVIACIGKQSHTHRIIRKTGEFAINIPTLALLDKVYACGQVSGREVDKFRKFKFTPIPAQKISAPLIKECVAHLECKVFNESLANEHSIFLAKVVTCSADKEVFDKFLNVKKKSCKTLHHLTGKYFFVPGKIVVAR